MRLLFCQSDIIELLRSEGLEFATAKDQLEIENHSLKKEVLENKEKIASMDTLLNKAKEKEDQLTQELEKMKELNLTPPKSSLRKTRSNEGTETK